MKMFNNKQEKQEEKEPIQKEVLLNEDLVTAGTSLTKVFETRDVIWELKRKLEDLQYELQVKIDNFEWENRVKVEGWIFREPVIEGSKNTKVKIKLTAQIDTE